LWVRTLRQLAMLAVALFFFSCEDETSILGFKGPKKFNVALVEIPLNTSSVLAVDSAISDLRPVVVNGQTSFVDGLLVGQYQDNVFGKVEARSFLSLYPSSTIALESSSVYDSITVELRLNFYSYGFTGVENKNFFVHEITGDTVTLFGGNRYYTNSTAPEYSVDPIGEMKMRLDYDSLLKQSTLSSQQDTILAKARLNDTFGTKVFEAVKEGVSGAAAQRLFKAQVRGLALVPAADNPGIYGMNVINDFGKVSRVFLHYHTVDGSGGVADTLVRTLGIDYASFTKVDTDRTGTELEGIQPYQGTETLSGLRYIQSGSPIITKLDLAPFYAFADTVDNILINSAEFVIENLDAPPGQRPPGSLTFRLMNNNSEQFLNTRVAADAEFLSASQYFILASDHYFTPSNGTSIVSIGYKADENRYSGFMTLFTQTLFTNKGDQDGINENRLKYLALVPSNPPLERSVSRAVFSKDDVKLRIYYTRANPVTP